MNRDAQRGYVVWVVLLAIAVAVIGAWRYSEAPKQRAGGRAAGAGGCGKASPSRPGSTRSERRSSNVKHKEQAQKDALASSLKAMDTLVARWDDAVKVASTTGRIALSGPVATLQAIRRETEGVTVPPLPDAGKAGLLRSMSSTEKGFLRSCVMSSTSVAPWRRVTSMRPQQRWRSTSAGVRDALLDAHAYDHGEGAAGRRLVVQVGGVIR